MSLQLVIFDVDGLLLDTERVWQEVWRDVAEAYHVEELGEELFRRVIGISGRRVRELLAESLKGCCDPEEFLERARGEGLRRLETQLRVKPGVFDILSYVRQRGISCAVATSTCRELTEERLRRMGLYDRFDYICCGDEVERGKPFPDIYLNTLQKMNVRPERALVFEDSWAGVEAAYRAGIPCVMVPDLLPATERERQRVKRIIPSLKQGYGIIDEMICEDAENRSCIEGEMYNG